MKRMYAEFHLQEPTQNLPATQTPGNYLLVPKQPLQIRKVLPSNTVGLLTLSSHLSQQTLAQRFSVLGEMRGY